MALLTPTIFRFDSLPSTNLEAIRQASEGADEGLCIVAQEQTAGRGRMGRHWTSPKGAGLYFSIVLRPTLAQRTWPLLTLMASLAVQDALFESCGVNTDIKWPNDVMAEERKLSGILAETVERTAGSFVIVGIGINLTRSSFPSELAGVATSVEAVSGSRPDAELILDYLVKALSLQYQKLTESNGTDMLIMDWCARSTYCSGKRIKVVEGEETFVGTTRGLETDGGLKVETDDGQMRVIRAGDVFSIRAENASP